MNNKLSNRFYQLISIGLVCASLNLLSLVAHAQDEQVAGRIIRVSGTVEAVNSLGSRPLTRGDQFFVGDTITTGPSGFVQMRLTDSAIIGLKADTVFEINEYSYQSTSGREDAATMRLLEGGFRTITGGMNKEAYKVETPFATIGIRGTDHEGLITPEGLVVGVYQGGTSISNEGGLIELGVGADFDFALAFSDQEPPVGLPGAPNELGSIVIDPNDDGALEEDEDSAGNGGSAGSNGSTAANSNNSGTTRTLPSVAAAATIRDESTINGVVPGNSASTPSSTRSATGQGQVNAIAFNPNDSGDGRIVTSPTPTIPNTPAPDTTPSAGNNGNPGNSGSAGNSGNAGNDTAGNSGTAGNSDTAGNSGTAGNSSTAGNSGTNKSGTTSALTAFALSATESSASTSNAQDSLGIEWGDWNASAVNNWTGQLATDAQTLFSSSQLTP